MACYRPVTGYRSAELSPGGKRPLVFDKSKSLTGIPVEISCGRCIGCRLSKAQEWALRCLHEASLYEKNSFITLTYDDDHLPRDKSLDKSEFQRFMKRLRFKFNGQKIRFFHSGEYGSECKICGGTAGTCLCTNPSWGLGRPHYHAILFNLDFEDKELWSEREGICLYRSQTLEELWGLGFSSVGDVTIESAGYVARYTLKKQSGENYDRVYPISCEITGEILGYRDPEYSTQSRRPGVGRDWFTKYHADCYPKDYITESGKKYPIPSYYDRILEGKEPSQLERIKEARQVRARQYRSDNTDDRLATKERCKVRQTQLLKRGL